jgi:hypothetical protein
MEEVTEVIWCKIMINNTHHQFVGSIMERASAAKSYLRILINPCD